MRYFVYCRKSQEAEERQALSLESQKQEIHRAFGNRSDIQIVEILAESKSARAPGRPIFNQMLDRIKRKEADGVIAWHPDRLARNSIDGGQTIYLLDEGVIKDLRFANFSFENTSQGKFMLQIMFGYSKYYVDNLSENVKRGNRAKIAQGWRPNMAPIGYLNDHVTRTIIPDPERFHLLRRLFERALAGVTSLRELREESKRWSLRTRKKPRGGGIYLSTSTIHRVLRNPFYAGILCWTGSTYRGAHQPIVTIAEFDQVQRVMGRPGKSAYQKHIFAFTGLIRCGECGMTVTAEEQINRYGRRYEYYHCSRRRRDYRCRQASVRREHLELMAQEMLASMTIPERIYRFLLQELPKQRNSGAAEIKRSLEGVDRAINFGSRALSNVIDLRVREMISEDEFLRQRQLLQDELVRLHEERGRLDNATAQFESFEDLISFSSRAVDWFIQGDATSKRLILRSVGSNPILKEKKLSIEARKPFVWMTDRAAFSNLRAVRDVVRIILTEQDPALLTTLQLVKETIKYCESLEKKQMMENVKESREPEALPAS